MSNDVYKRELLVRPDALDMNDPVDRQKAKTADRLAWVCDQERARSGRDPRGGGYSFVAHPQVIQQMLCDFASPSDRRLHKPVVIGQQEADVVFWWHDIPVRVRHMAKFPDAHLVPNAMLIARPDENEDRRAAAELRMAAHKGEIRVVS